MSIRVATVEDIPAMHSIRTAVQENVLSNPNKITPQDYQDYILQHGKGWVHVDYNLNGFAIVDLHEHILWALFVHPEKEGIGIGKALHDTMLAWYFGQTSIPLSATTDPGTRAERFYRSAGWVEQGMIGSEILLMKYK